MTQAFRSLFDQDFFSLSITLGKLGGVINNSMISLLRINSLKVEVSHNATYENNILRVLDKYL